MSLKEKVARNLERLREYAGYLRVYQRFSVEDLQNDPTMRGSVERYLHLSAECVIDIAEILVGVYYLKIFAKVIS